MSDQILEDMYQVILDRKEHPMEGSYTCYLFEKGLDKILKKVGRRVRRPSLRQRTMCPPILWGRSTISFTMCW